MSNRFASIVALAMALVSISCDRGADTQSQAADSAAANALAPMDSISVTGLMTPESVLYDDVADVYLVSNINGDPLGRDDNGFISVVGPDGTVQNLKFVDGAAANVRLHAPKGMAIIGDTLFVSDIDSVRAFQRTTGAPLGSRGVPGSTFLNDLASVNGVLYVTDSGFKPDFSPSGTEAIYRFENGKPVVVVKDTSLGSPNGIANSPEGLLYVPARTQTVWRIPAAGGAKVAVGQMPIGGMDGIERLPDGSLLISSWDGKAVYKLDAQGQAQPIVQNVESPADIGYDSKRNRVLIPLFMQNRVEIRGLR